ncbi:MAG: hypothetical protein IBX41_06625 [Methanophagales archaeon]|nr:hypothetical protein [Methanophagales archaeon]
MWESPRVVMLLFVFGGIVLVLASVSVSGQHPLIKDTDGDGIPDGWEVEHGLNPYDASDAQLDYNYNGRTNFQEYQNGSDPWDKDTDKDGISNYAESFGLFGFFTDPLAEDTDGDGLSDLEEICWYIDTGNPAHMKEIYPNENDIASKIEKIMDLRRKYPYKLDPTNSDTDGDGLSDGDEVHIYKTDPTKWDTDGDGLSDGDEVHIYGTDPTKWDTDGDGLSDYEEIFIYGTDPTKWDTDGDGLSDGEEIFGFGFAPIEPSERALTYEEFLSGAYSGEYITVKAKVDMVRYHPDLDNYLIFLKPLEEPKEGVEWKWKRGVARVNSSWYYVLQHGEMVHVDSRFELALRDGDTIVLVGKAGKFLGNTREIEVDSEGKMYLVLSPEEAQGRWLPSKEYVKIISDSSMGSGTVPSSPTPSPAQPSTSTPVPTNSSLTPGLTSVNETNESASGSGLKKEGKGIVGSLIYVLIGVVIVIATLFLYTKFGGRIPMRRERKEGEGSKPVEASSMQKGTRKEWS